MEASKALQPRITRMENSPGQFFDRICRKGTECRPRLESDLGSPSVFLRRKSRSIRWRFRHAGTISGTELSSRKTRSPDRMNTVFIVGGFELIGRVEPLWVRLRDHHANASPYFSREIAQATFGQRKEDFSQREKGGGLFVCLAALEAADVGYVVASVANFKAEIDSIFVSGSIQGRGVGTELMRRALDWIKNRQATSLCVNVAYGNTRVFDFYRRFGVFPRSINLHMKESNPAPAARIAHP